jgi:hypothetical protein
MIDNELTKKIAELQGPSARKSIHDKNFTF